MIVALYWIIAIGLLAWFWLDSARARELAIALVNRLCAQHEAQFLDGSVVLRRIGLQRGAHGLCLRRMFSFDFSNEGIGRQTGYIILLGIRLEQYSGFDLPSENTPKDTVVPFRHPPKRDP